MSRGLIVVLAALAACGDDGDVHRLTDAPPAPDAMLDAPSSGPVTLRITRGGMPRVAIDVYFQAADGTLIAKVPTNAQGLAMATMEAGGYVTVVNPITAKGADEVRTLAGIKPGDQLVLEEPIGVDRITVNLSVPNDPAATQYDVFTTCGYQQQLQPGVGSGAPALGPIDLDGCTSNVADILIVTIDALGNPSRYLYKAGVAVTDQATVDFSAETYTSPVPEAQLTWTNVSPAYTGIELYDTLTTVRGPLLRTIQVAGIEGTGATATIARPMTSAGAMSIMSSHPTPTNGFGWHVVVDWGPAGTATTFDLGNVLLGALTGAPTFDLGTRTLTWFADPGNTPDLVWTRIVGTRTASTPTQRWSWSIAAPYTGTSLVLPKLPIELDKYNFTSGDTLDTNELSLAKVPGGIDAVRSKLLSVVRSDTFVSGPSGRIVFEFLESQVQFRAPVGSH